MSHLWLATRKIRQVLIREDFGFLFLWGLLLEERKSGFPDNKKCIKRVTRCLMASSILYLA